MIWYVVVILIFIVLTIAGTIVMRDNLDRYFGQPSKRKEPKEKISKEELERRRKIAREAREELERIKADVDSRTKH